MRRVGFLGGMLLGLAAVAEGGPAFALYNVVNFSATDEHRIAADIREYRDRTGQNLALYMLTLNPVGRPAIDLVKFKVESFRRLKMELEGSGIRLGVLVQAIIGHGWPSAELESESWQRTIDITGAEKRFCPLSEGFREYVRSTFRMIAEAGAEYVMTDDDCRSFSPQAECFCPLHVAEFNRRTQGSYTSESLRAAVRQARPGDAVHTAFANLQRDTVAGMMREMRAALDAVNPQIPACCSTPGQNREVANVPTYAATIARKGDDSVVRINNGYYVEQTPREFPKITLFTMGVCEYLADKVPILLDEADTCPHTLWAKSSMSFFSHLSVAALSGCRGAKVWFVNGRRGDVEVSRNYTDVLAARRGYLDALVGITAGSRPTGVVIPCTDSYAEGVNIARGGYQIPPTCDKWVEGSFGLMGIPFRTSFRKDEDAVYALGGKLEGFSNAELKSILSRRVLVDSDAAAALCARGFSESLGLRIGRGFGQLKFEFEADDETGDIVPFAHFSGAPEFIPSKEARVCSWLCGRLSAPPTNNTRENPKGYRKIAPGAVLFKNPQGGTVLTVAWHSHPFVLEHRMEERQRWLWRMLDRVNGAPFDNMIANAQDVLAITRRSDGEDLVAGFNLNFDPIHRVLVRRAVRPTVVRLLDRRGAWQNTEFSWKDGILSVNADVMPYDHVLLGIR